MNFLPGKHVLSEKDLLEKAPRMKIFEFTSLGKELKTQTGIAKKQYQALNRFFKSNEKEEPTLKKYNKSNLIYNNKNSFKIIIVIVKDLITFLLN